MCFHRMLLLMIGVNALAAAPLRGQDPLDDLVREGLRNNLGLRQERLDDARAEASVREARARYLPSVGFDARYSESRGGLDLGELVNPAYRALNQLTGSTAFPTDVEARLPLTQETRLRLTQPVWNGTIRSGHRITRGLRDLQGAALDAASRRLAADIQRAYVGYATTSRVAELYAATLALTDENVRVNERLLEHGVITSDAVHRARAERGEIRQRLADARRDRRNAAERLNFLLGRQLDADVTLLADSLLDRGEPVSLNEALAVALQRREELRQVESSRRIAHARERLARAQQMPAVAVVLDYGVQGTTYRFGPGHDVLVASVIVQWSLFDGGQEASRRQQARLDGSRAVLQRQELERQIAMQVRQAHASVLTAGQAIATADERLASARRSFELTSRRYEEGMAPLIEYLDARTTYTSAGLNRILTFYDYIARRIDLEQAAALRPLTP